MDGMSKSVIVVGTGGYALELVYLLKSACISVKGCIGPKNKLSEIWLGPDDELGCFTDDYLFVVAIGDVQKRSEISKKILSLGGEFFSFIHENSFVAENAQIGAGCVIYPGAIIHSNTLLGAGVLVNSGATIGHETQIGNFSNISPGVSIGGNCTIGNFVHVGIGSTIIEKVFVSDLVTIGAGAAVISNIEHTNATYIGVPANSLNR